MWMQRAFSIVGNLPILNVTFNWLLIAFAAELEVWLVVTFSVVSTSDVLG
jgi:hypothetical protein